MQVLPSALASIIVTSIIADSSALRAIRKRALCTQSSMTMTSVFNEITSNILHSHCDAREKTENETADDSFIRNDTKTYIYLCRKKKLTWRAPWRAGQSGPGSQRRPPDASYATGGQSPRSPSEHPPAVFSTLQALYLSSC